MGFIPEITTRVTTIIEHDLDDAIARVESDPILSKASGLINLLNDKKTQLENLKEPVSYAVADKLSSNQEMIISSKHYITGMMANSVDIMQDGEDYLVGNTAMSIDGFPYPLSIEKGRREVYPIDKSVLRWFNGSTPVFSKHSKSVPADPFVKPSIEDTRYDIEQIVSNELHKGGVL